MKGILSDRICIWRYAITDTGELIDPLQFYTDKIKDTTPPRASMIMLYPQRALELWKAHKKNPYLLLLWDNRFLLGENSRWH